MLVDLPKTHADHIILCCGWFVSYISEYGQQYRDTPIHTFKHHTQLTYKAVMINDISFYNTAELNSWFLTQITLSDHCKGTYVICLTYCTYVFILQGGLISVTTSKIIL